jgi:hypothetical protein
VLTAFGASGFGITGDVAVVAVLTADGGFAGGSIGAGVRVSPAVAGAGIGGRRSFDASSSFDAAARVFMNPAEYTTTMADELRATRRFATLLLFVGAIDGEIMAYSTVRSAG